VSTRAQLTTRIKATSEPQSIIKLRDFSSLKRIHIGADTIVKLWWDDCVDREINTVAANSQDLRGLATVTGGATAEVEDPYHKYTSSHGDWSGLEDVTIWLEESEGNNNEHLLHLESFAFREPNHRVGCRPIWKGSLLESPSTLCSKFACAISVPGSRRRMVKAAYDQAGVQLHCWSEDELSPSYEFWQRAIFPNET